MNGLNSQPDPVTNYAEAASRLEALQAAASQATAPACHPRLLGYHQKTEQVILLLSGLANYPQQLRKLGLTFFKLGHNVLTACLPPPDWSQPLTTTAVVRKAEALAGYTDTVVDLGRGLGQRVVLVGFSSGGVMAAWAAQQRDDIDHAVLIAPFFSYRFIPDLLNQRLTKLILKWPDLRLWRYLWQKIDLCPPASYPGQTGHPLGEVLQLSLYTRSQARQSPPQAGRVTMVLNSNDRVVNNRTAAKVADQWRKNGYESLELYHLNKGLGLPHNLFAPAEESKAALAQPLLVRLITRQI